MPTKNEVDYVYAMTRQLKIKFENQWIW